jgi:predicted Rossmann fold flavoprotein
MAALFAARSGSPVVLIERTPDGGRKILISGGGRCNILPEVSAPERFVTDSSPNTLRNMLRSWPLAEQVEFFERELAMRLVVEDPAKLFPETNRARDVRDRLLSRAQEAGVRTWFDARVTALRAPVTPGAAWTVDIEGAPSLVASAVIVATGGLSVPATGSDGAGLAIVRDLGHRENPTYPALTPLLAEPHAHRHLSGVSLDVTLTAPATRPVFSSTGGFLITHRGYSGPAVLDVSHLATRSGGSEHPARLCVRWTDRTRQEWDQELQRARGTVRQAVGDALPARLLEQLLREAAVAPTHKIAELARPDRQRLAGLLGEYELPWTGDAGYQKAEVTGGGIDLQEVDPRTMQSRRHPGLFLAGEILDAFGPIGGHNFQWAWATGRLAGRGAANAVVAQSDA